MAITVGNFTLVAFESFLLRFCFAGYFEIK